MNNWKKNTALFLISQGISLFGAALVQYSITWYITLKSQSGIMMTLSIICGFLPTFFISPFAGVWADRYNRKILVALADVIMATAILTMAILFSTGHNAIWLLFIISAVRAIGAGMQTPSVSAVIPQLVPEDRLTRINGINSTIQSLIMLVSPMLSGALLTIANIQTIFYIACIVAILAVLVLVLFVDIPIHEKALSKEPISYFKDTREGFSYIKNHDYVRNYFLFCTVFFILVAPLAFLTPLQVTRTFGNDVWRLTAVEITFSIGMMIGGVIISSWGGFKNKVHTMTLASFVTGICTFLLGVIPNFWIYLSLISMSGVTMVMFNTPATVLLQEKVEGDFLGRVFGVLNMISSIMMPLGMLVYGPLADIIKIEWMLIVTGILMFIQGFFLLGNKVLIEAGRPVEKKES